MTAKLSSPRRRGSPEHRKEGTTIIKKTLKIFIFLFALCVCTPAFAGNPLVIHPTTGNSIGWEEGGAIPYWLDQGTLGVLTNEQASSLANAMMNTWAAVPTANVGFVFQGALPEDVTEKNFGDYYAATGCGASRRADIPLNVVPIVFDTDGKILDSIAGEGASADIGGIAMLRCFNGTAAEPNNIYQGMLIINGQFVDGKGPGENSTPDLDVNIMGGIILHELGHLIGLDHTSLNEEIYDEVFSGARPIEDSKYLPVMLPIVLRGSTSSTVLKPDDVAAISSMYPKDDFLSTTGTIYGDVKNSNGVDFQKAGVIARLQSDPLCEVFGAVTGRRCTPLTQKGSSEPDFNGTACGSPEQSGDYSIEGVPPGDYTVEVEEIPRDWIRDGMFPSDIDEDLPGNAIYYDGGNAIVVPAGSGIRAINFVLDASVATEAQLDRMPVADLVLGPTTRCGFDPVDYSVLLGDGVEILPAQSATPGDGLGSLDDGLAGDGSSGGGCSLARSTPDIMILGLFIFAIVFQHFRSMEHAHKMLETLMVGQCKCTNKKLINHIILKLSSPRRRLFPKSVCHPERNEGSSANTLKIGIRSVARDDKNSLKRFFGMKQICLVMLILAGFSSSLFASTVVPLSLGEMKEKSGHIFYGTCTDVRTSTAENGMPVQEVTYKITRAVAGAESGKTITFKTLGAAIGAPSYHKGKESVLFLRPESSIGLTSPVGLWQGDVPVETKEDGSKVVKFAKKPANAVSSKTIKKGDDIALSPDEFLDLVESDSL